MFSHLHPPARHSSWATEVMQHLVCGLKPPSLRGCSIRTRLNHCHFFLLSFLWDFDVSISLAIGEQPVGSSVLRTPCPHLPTAVLPETSARATGVPDDKPVITRTFYEETQDCCADGIQIVIPIHATPVTAEELWQPGPGRSYAWSPVSGKRQIFQVASKLLPGMPACH